MGLYDEYSRFRRGYLQWRQGNHSGACGEHTATALALGERRTTERVNLERWYPTYAIWSWNRTTSYWIAVLFTEGSLLFFIGSIFSCFPDELGRQYKALASWPTVFGGVQFNVAAYLMCLETMNVGRPPEEWRYQPFAVKSILRQLDELQTAGQEVTRLGYFISLSYFVGTLIYYLPLCVGLAKSLTPMQTLWLSVVPYIAGGLPFAVGGFMECVENAVFTSCPKRLPWWASLMNFIGGMCYFAGGVVLLWELNLISGVLFAFGSVLFFIGGVLSVLMWKDEQFGLTFMAGMNKYASASFIERDEATSGAQSATFSVRGVIFILTYCIISALAVADFCLALNEFFLLPCFFTATHAFNQALPFLLLHMVLLLHSAVVKTPNVQPYHFLIIGMRYFSVIIGINAVISFCDFVQPHGPIPFRPLPPPPYPPLAHAQLII